MPEYKIGGLRMKKLIFTLGMLLFGFPTLAQTEATTPTKTPQENINLAEKYGLKTFTLPKTSGNPFFQINLFQQKILPFNYYPEEHHDFGRFFSVSVAHPYVITNDPSELVHAYDRPKTKLNFNMKNLLGHPDWMRGFNMYLSPTFRLRERSNTPFRREEGVKFGFRMTIIKPHRSN